MSVADETKAWESGEDYQALKVKPIKELQIGRDYDKVVLNEVSPTIHEYTYTLNEVEIITLRVTYTNSSDKIVQSLEVV